MSNRIRTLMDKNYSYKNLKAEFLNFYFINVWNGEKEIIIHLKVWVEDNLLFFASLYKDGVVYFRTIDEDEEPVTFKCQDDYYIKVKRFVRNNDGKISDEEMIKYFIRVGDELSKMAGKPLPEKLMAELLLNYLG